MHWYEKLNQYFPVEEMKSREHMETLLKERSDIYHKDEGPNHVLMYAELDDFVFIDYLFVSKNARGQGLGHKLIEKMRKKVSLLFWKWNLLTMKTVIVEKGFIFINVKVLNTQTQSDMKDGR